MALLSILSTDDSFLHSRFFGSPLPTSNPGKEVAGSFGALSYRISGPRHLDYLSGETSRTLWMLEGETEIAVIRLSGLVGQAAEDWLNGSLNLPGLHRKLTRYLPQGFVLTILSRSHNQALILNDRLGRLPLYRYTAPGTVMISRQIFHLRETISGLIPNPVGRGFHLLLGYPPNDDTLWLDVKRIGPGRAQLIHNSTCEEQLIDDALFSNPTPGLSFDQTLNQVQQHLSTSFRSLSGRQSVLSMSGGLDSRLLAAALHQQGISFRMVSYRDASGTARPDVTIARAVAETLGKNLDVIDLPQPGTNDFRSLQHLKQGLNYSGMAFLLPFLRQLKDEGSVITGDGGDKLLAPLRHVPPLFTLNALARFIIRKHALMPDDVAEKIAGLEPGALTRLLTASLEKLYRTDLSQVYADFQLRQRAFKWLFEGEDRNRWFLQHKAPIWDEFLATFLLSIPEAYKRNYRLFTALLNSYHPGLANIANANWGFSPTETRLLGRLLWRQRWKNTWPVATLTSAFSQLHPGTVEPPPTIFGPEWESCLKSIPEEITRRLTIDNFYYLYSLHDEKPGEDPSSGWHL